MLFSLVRLHVAKNFLSHLHPPPSYRTWVRIYHKSWEKTIRFRTENQHAKCTVCLTMKEHKRQASTVSDSTVVANAYIQHLNLMMEDRKADAVWRQIGFDSVRTGITCLHEGVASWLTFTVDGMDCAKFKIPLNISKTKDFCSMHRPEMKLTPRGPSSFSLNTLCPKHLMLIRLKLIKCLQIHCWISKVADGLLEHFFLMDEDIAPTSNLDLSLMTETMSRCYYYIQRIGKASYPRGLRVHADNAAAETKNQVAFKFGAYLLWNGYFDNVVWSYFQTGHSHGLPDQRFSEVRHLLFQESVLECPKDFIKVLQQVKPRQQRELLITSVDGL